MQLQTLPTRTCGMEAELQVQFLVKVAQLFKENQIFTLDNMGRSKQVHVDTQAAGTWIANMSFTQLALFGTIELTLKEI
jgi:hypothetical protein